MAAQSQFISVFWGESIAAGLGHLLGVAMPFLILMIYSQFKTPEPSTNWLAVVGAVLIAGYYVWRADHIRLMPQLGIGDTTMIYSGTGLPGQRRRYVQIALKCETEGPVKNCRGQLLHVSEWKENSDGLGGKWELTHLNETLDLLWSFIDEPIVTLEHGAPRRLNLLYVENSSSNITIFTKMRVAFTAGSGTRLKFKVRVVGEGCPPVYIAVEVVKSEPWCELIGLRAEETDSETI